MLKYAKPSIAAALVLAGLYLIAFGNSWAPIAFALLPETELGTWLELLVPFLPMPFVGLGAALFTWENRG